MGPHLLALSLFGLPLSPRGVANALLGDLTSWVALGSARLVATVGHVLDATTAPPLGGASASVFDLVGGIGALGCVPLLLLSILQAVLRQDLGELLRTVFVRLPLAFLLAGAAVGLVGLALHATDELSGALLASGGGGRSGVLGRLAHGLGAAEPAGVVGAGFEGLFLALVAFVVGFALWLELVVRSAAVAVATLFVPLALAGLVWPATAHWARRLGETITGLVCSKVVVAGVLALAGTSVAPGAGIAGVVEGIALLVLAVVAPFSLLRLIPLFESGASSSLEGLGGRAARQTWRAAAGLELGGADAGLGATTAVDDLHPGSLVDPVTLDAAARAEEATLLVVEGDGAEPGWGGAHGGAGDDA